MILSTDMYATALFEYGVENDSVFAFRDAIDSFLMVLEDDAVAFVFSKTLDTSKDFAPLWQSLRTVYPEQFVNFLEIVQSANLMKHLSRIADDYKRLMMRDGYLNRVQVTTPYTLSDDEQAALVKLLKEQYKNEFEFHYDVDPSLIHGMIVQVNHDVYDTSIRSKLNRVLKQGGKS